MPPIQPSPAAALLSRSSRCCSPRFSLPSPSSSPSPSTSTLIHRALFSSTAPRPQQQIPPESPLYINVPNPPQDQSIEALRELKPVKGHMPTPRRIFRHRDGHLKASTQYLDKSAPKPTSPRSQLPPGSDIQAWKRRMADSRRENMAAGLRALLSRKQRIDQWRKSERERKLAANRAAATAPEREDDRLTRSTINARTLATAVVDDPLRFERALEARERTSALLAARSERRRDAIQELYMSAREGFIVDDAGLEAAVEKEFRPDAWTGKTASGQPIKNIWDLDGPPVTIADMLREVSGRDSRVVSNLQTEDTKTGLRQKRVAEELTGGKIE